MLSSDKPDKPNSPEVLLSLIASGYKPAETQLVHRYWRPLYLMLFNDCQDHSIASDLAQETLCVCLVKAREGEIREAKALTSFVHRTATNLLIAHKRKEKRHKTDTTDDLDRLFGEVDGPAQQVQRDHIVSLVASVLNEMPVARDRDILVEYFVHGTPKEELCELLSLSPEHFDRVLYRARQRLKQKLSIAIKQAPGNVSLVSLLGCGLVVLLCGESLSSNKMALEVGDIAPVQHLSKKRHNQLTLSAVKSGSAKQGEGRDG